MFKAQKLPVTVADTSIHDPTQCGLTVLCTRVNVYPNQSLEPLNGPLLSLPFDLHGDLQGTQQSVPNVLLFSIRSIDPLRPKDVAGTTAISIFVKIGNNVAIKSVVHFCSCLFSVCSYYTPKSIYCQPLSKIPPTHFLIQILGAPARVTHIPNIRLMSNMC